MTARRRRRKPRDSSYVSRGGEKLAYALDRFEIDATGSVAADLGSNVGGFVDCLLRRGASKVFSVDTSYGVLAWKLRTDPRVVVMERCNALHVDLPEPMDLITIDVGWTPQHRIVPHARALLNEQGRILSLLKPQYEAQPDERVRGVVRPEALDEVVRRTCARLEASGIAIKTCVESPLQGSGGNVEYWLLISR